MIRGIEYTKFKFPAGELHIKLIDATPRSVNLQFEFENMEEVYELLLLADTLKRNHIKIASLEMPYVPFSRQDRVNEVGECFSLDLFCKLINSIRADEIVVTDPHSDVATALLNNCRVIPQHEIMGRYLGEKFDFWLICPDAGNLKKTYKLASKVACAGVIECSKLRNTKTGEITETRVYTDDLQGKECVIVDDICDGGRTFIEIAKVLKTKNCGKISLMVTHGFFTKGLWVFDGLIDEVYDRKRRVK